MLADSFEKHKNEQKMTEQSLIKTHLIQMSEGFDRRTDLLNALKKMSSKSKQLSRIG